MLRTIALVLLMGAPAAAAELYGYISDAACGWNNARETKEAKECARMCVKEGWAPVFVRDGGMAVYQIPDASKKQALDLIGEHVKIVGEIKGQTVNVSSIAKSPPPKPAAKK